MINGGAKEIVKRGEESDKNISEQNRRIDRKYERGIRKRREKA